MHKDMERDKEIKFDGVWHSDGQHASISAFLQSGRVRFRLNPNEEDIADFSFSETDLRNLLERSGREEQTDLRRLYPGVANEVDAQSTVSDESNNIIRAMSFRVNVKASNRSLLRYRGEPRFSQALLEIAGIKAGSRPRSNGGWTEYTEMAMPGSFERIDQYIFRSPLPYNIIYRTVDGFKSGTQFYINGKEVAFEDAFDSHKRIGHSGDVAVAIRRDDGVDSPDFFEMPIVTVFKQKPDLSTQPHFESEFCFSFQVAGLVGNTVDALVPFTSPVTGSKIASIKINGRDVERNLYSRRIRRGDNVRIIIK